MDPLPDFGDPLCNRLAQVCIAVDDFHDTLASDATGDELLFLMIAASARLFARIAVFLEVDEEVGPILAKHTGHTWLPGCAHHTRRRPVGRA